jgi:hypothetical protein
MPDETPLPQPAPTPLVKSERRPPLGEPAAIFIAIATIFAIIINSQNVGPILMLGVIALLLELRLRPRD